MPKTRILSGMRPTGKLHLGHLFGAIANWVELQRDYECFYMVADWHALTTAFMDTEDVKENIRQVCMDYIAGGLDPEKCTFYVQSHVPEIAELYQLMAPLVPVSWLERTPSYKDQIEQLGQELANFGFLGYPVLMTCDIIAFKAEVVPVGQDQLPHLELCREIVRRFHHYYGQVFPEPHAKLTQFPNVPGIDGRKMSKSYNNSILISDDSAAIKKKVKMMITDPQKIYKGDPGNPEVCTVYYFQNIYNPDKVSEIHKGCTSGELGCVADKNSLAEAMIKGLAPVQEKRKVYEENPQLIDDILARGCEKARKAAMETLKDAKRAMKML
ncbi:MAG: tryptophan--tRNA ligase [Firmicutes bacterium]|nr:tryptophan--tRNA ligase [Bacillota bacterium]